MKKTMKVLQLLTIAALVIAVSTGVAYAGGSGLEIETRGDTWYNFLIGPVIKWGAAAGAIICGFLLFTGIGRAAANVVSIMAGICIMLGAVAWFIPSLGNAAGAMLF